MKRQWRELWSQAGKAWEKNCKDILTQFSMIRSAPESNKSWMISRHPFEQAWWSGVLPLCFEWWMKNLSLKNSPYLVRLGELHGLKGGKWSWYDPSSKLSEEGCSLPVSRNQIMWFWSQTEFGQLTSAPDSNRRETTSIKPLRQAPWRGVAPTCKCSDRSDRGWWEISHHSGRQLARHDLITVELSRCAHFQLHNEGQCGHSINVNDILRLIGEISPDFLQYLFQKYQ